MNILIRADASRRIGTGHVMRCLALADCLRKRGADICFWSEPRDGDLREVIRIAGYRLLESGGESQQPWDWLVVDHYSLDEKYETAMRQYVKKVFVIDDLANRKHDCDMLLDQNMLKDLGKRYNGLLPERCRRFLGPKFALLRPEFREARPKVIRRSTINKILVLFGGSDPTNETEKAIAAIGALRLCDVQFLVVLGQTNPNSCRIRMFGAAVPTVEVVNNLSKVSRAMVDCDLALTAGGATTWERCCLGLPSIVIAVADNQEPFSRYLGENGYQVYLGKSADVTETQISASILTALRNSRQMAKMGVRSMSLVDGLGADRIADAICEL